MMMMNQDDCEWDWDSSNCRIWEPGGVGVLMVSAGWAEQQQNWNWNKTIFYTQRQSTARHPAYNHPHNVTAYTSMQLQLVNIHTPVLYHIPFVVYLEKPIVLICQRFWKLCSWLKLNLCSNVNISSYPQDVLADGWLLFEFNDMRHPLGYQDIKCWNILCELQLSANCRPGLTEAIITSQQS